jgi:rhodanese-related sulfurtransferase
VGSSLCGSGSLTDATSSTIGGELQSNPLLRIAERAEFVGQLTASSPARPPRVARIVELNTTGPPDPPTLPELNPRDLSRRWEDGICVIDIREPDDYDRAHLTGSLNLPASGSSAGNRAAWATQPEEPIVLVGPSTPAARAFAERLLSAGLWNLSGVTAADPARWEAEGLAVGAALALTPGDVARGLAGGELELVDVRDASEWRLGHVQAARHLPLPELGDGSQVALPGGRPLAVACEAGTRAALAASVLRRRGYPLAARMIGGIPELLRLARLPAGSLLR